MHRVIRIIRLFRRHGGTFAPCLLSDGKRIGFTRRSYQLRACTGIHGHAFHAIRQCLSWNKRFLSNLVGIKRIAYSYFLRTPFSEIQYRCSSDNLVHRVARPCQRSFWIGICQAGLQIENKACGYAIVCLVILFSFLLISEIPMFSLKFKNLKLKENYLRYLILIAAAIFLIFFGLAGLAATIGLYIILSLLTAKKH